MKFAIGTRVKVILNKTGYVTWDKYIGTIGTVESYDYDPLNDQTYVVRLDFDGDAVTFAEVELVEKND